jgi:hypothetical protein
VANQGNDARGKPYEQLLVEEIGLGGDDWFCQGELTLNGEVRRYDAINGPEKIAYEFKSGRTIDAEQLAKDVRIAKAQGYRVVYLFGDKPTAATVRRLDAAGVGHHIMKASPNAVNSVRANTGQSARLMNPKTSVPARGVANDMFAGSGRNLDQAREAAQVDDDLARRSGRPDHRMRRPGGIDFSTLELKYVSETDNGQGLGYGFEAEDVEDEDTEPGFGGLEQAQLASDALFTWLAVQPSAFWVNLNPDTPNQITDDRLARTDAGRILLEADLTLKRSHAQLLDPGKPLGDSLWDGCTSTPRPWCPACPCASGSARSRPRCATRATSSTSSTSGSAASAARSAPSNASTWRAAARFRTAGSVSPWDGRVPAPRDVVADRVAAAGMRDRALQRAAPAGLPPVG